VDVCEHHKDHSITIFFSLLHGANINNFFLKKIGQKTPTSGRALLVLYSTIVHSSGTASSFE